MVAGLKVEIDEVEGTKIIHLEGRLDAATAPGLEAKLSDHLSGDKPHVVIDFSQIEYLSSAGMRLLLSSTKKVAGKGGNLALCSLGDEVMEIIRMAGFERILHIYSSEKAALESMS